MQRLARFAAQALGWVLLVFVFVGCHLIAKYKSAPIPPDRWYECSTDVFNCKKTNKAVSASVSRPSPTGSCYQVLSGFAVNQRAYCDQETPVRIKRIGYAPLRGATWIVTRILDNNDKSAAFLQLRWAAPIKGLYVAYDSRSKTKPKWLDSSDYSRLRIPGGAAATITVTSVTQVDVELELFRYRGALPVNQDFTIPGNFSGDPSNWPKNFNLKNAAMYMVILEPVQDVDCNNAESVYQSAHSGCYATPKAADVAAKKECDESLTEHTLIKQVCQPPVCKEVNNCPDAQQVKSLTGGLLSPWTYPKSSSIEFDPVHFTSRAIIGVAGNQYTRNVTGWLDFEYLLDDFGRMRKVRIDNMVLEVDPFNTPIGSVADIDVSLSSPVTASCQDVNPAWAAPCDTYRIDKDQLIAVESATIDGNRNIFLTRNTNVVDLKIDHVKRTFRIHGGPLRTTANEDPIDTSIDLSGHFRNFAPKANAVESMKVAECAWGEGQKAGNKEPILLDASGSFEIYNDPIASGAYRWFEDYGLATEKLWGSGERATIAPGEMSYGYHTMSLVIRDSFGVVDADTFEIEVRDSAAPKIHVPPDVYALPPQPGPMKLGIGMARADDLCEAKVTIRNDAPAGLVFPPGTTIVTWEADDGRGHVTAGTQSVFVFSVRDAGYPGSFVEHAVELAGALSQGAVKSLKTLEACRDSAAGCQIPMEGLAAAAHRLNQVVEGLSLADEALQAELYERSGEALARLEEASEMLAKAEGTARSQARMRAGASEFMAVSAELLASVEQLLATQLESQDD